MNSPPMTLGHRSQGLPVRSPDEIRSSVHSGQSHGGIAHDNLGLITAPAGFAQKMVFNAIFCSELFRMRLGPKVSAGLIPDVDRGCCGPAAKVLLPLCPFILLGLVRWDFCSPGRRRLESKGPGRYSVAVRRHRWL